MQCGLFGWMHFFFLNANSIAHQLAHCYTYMSRRTLELGEFLADPELEAWLRKYIPQINIYWMFLAFFLNCSLMFNH